MHIKRYLILFFLMFMLGGCASSEAVKKTDFCMDTYISITVYNAKDETLIDEAFARCHEYEAILSKTAADSDISRLQSSRFDYIPVSQETKEIISIYQSLYEASGQKLDPTIGALTALWDFHDTASDPVLPNETVLHEALSSIDHNALLLKGDTACLASETAMLDFGAVAKGYVSGKIRDFLIENGVKSAILDFGGNIVVIGDRPDGKPYHIGIQRPFSNQNDVALALSVSDTSVITAGVYQRYFIYDDEICHHILDPKTGRSAASDLFSATIICDDPALADAYSTVCILLGKEKALQLINNTENMEGIFITDDDETVTSAHAAQYIDANHTNENRGE